jgi:hypothetical protein
MPTGFFPNQLLNQIPGGSSNSGAVVTPELLAQLEQENYGRLTTGRQPLELPEVGSSLADFAVNVMFQGDTDTALRLAGQAGIPLDQFNAEVSRISQAGQDRRGSNVLVDIGRLTRVGRGEVTGVDDFFRDTAALGAIGYGTTFLGGGTAPGTTTGTATVTGSNTAAGYAYPTAGGAVVPGATVSTAAPSAVVGPAVKGGAMALSGLDWANIGTSILGLLGSKEAGDTQADAANTAAAGLERADIRAREDLQPFREAGGEVLNPLVDFAMKGPETELERTEGFTNIQNSAAAGGKLRSGGTLKALTEFNSMLNSRNRSQRFNELFNLATLGSNAASRQATNTLNTAQGVGEYGTQGANAKAAGIVGGTNQLSNLFNNFVFMRALGG